MLSLKRYRQRLFARMNAQNKERYEQATAARKRALFSNLHGDVLEIGPGSGPNLRYYPPDVRWLGIEPNPFMHPYLHKTIESLGRPRQNYRVELGDPAGKRLPVEDASVDVVVSTLVMCSVGDPDSYLQEVLRVLKPGGRFIFMEHVAAPPGDRLRTWQNVLQPLWTLVADGCHPNRETWETIAQAGFARVDMDHFRVPDANVVGPHIAGVAIKGPL